MRTDTRGAFTLVELLVVVGIIGVLIALLLPAVQSSREIARKIQCTNNLHQLGVALENYASSHRVYPPGVVDFQGPVSGAPIGYRFSWAALILPFMEQKNVYNHLNFLLGVYADGNVSEFEDNVMWRAADLLGVSSRDRIQLKHRVAQDAAQEQTDSTA